jgi:hypothetical protein
MPTNIARLCPRRSTTSIISSTIIIIIIVAKKPTTLLMKAVIRALTQITPWLGPGSAIVALSWAAKKRRSGFSIDYWNDFASL